MLGRDVGRVANFRPTVGSSLSSPKVCHSLKSCSVESTPSPELKRVGGRPLLRRRNAGSMRAACTVLRYPSVSLNLSIASEVVPKLVSLIFVRTLAKKSDFVV